MKIIRATSTAVIPYIQDKIEPCAGIPKEQYLADLTSWLVQSPQTLFLQIAIDTDDSVKGFMIGIAPPNVDYVYISQVVADNDNIATQFLLRLSQWAGHILRSQIRIDTEADQKNYSGLWQFKTITETRGADLDEITNDLLGVTRDEPVVEQPLDGNSVEGESGDSGKEVVEPSTGGVSTNA